MEVYVIQNGEQAGPFTRFKLREKISRGEIDEETLGWYRGLDEWAPLNQIEALKVVLAESEEGDGPSSPELAGAEASSDEKDYSAPMRAWIRFWARNLDVTYFMTGTLVVTGATGWMDMYEFMDPNSASVSPAYVVILLGAWAFVESALLSSFGTTPGRALLGVKLTDGEGEFLSTSLALKRSFFVWFRGMGFGLPLLNIVMAGLSYMEVVRTNTTWWDDRTGSVVTHKRVRFARVLMAIAIAFLLFGLAMSFSELPPEMLEGAKDAPERENM
ncbi:MAG: RDD family protein [Verrucomicrobiota bacterium]